MHHSLFKSPEHCLTPVQAKRDSFSDSGAEGSGTNTPTRGRTMTEGLLRFVQDGSVVRPLAEAQKRQSTVEQPAHPGPPAAGAPPSGRFSALSNPGSGLSGPAGREASVIQPVPGQYAGAGVIQTRFGVPEFGVQRPYLPLAPSPFHPAPPHYMSYPVPLPPGYAPGKSLGSAPPYGAPPVYPQHPAPAPYMYQYQGSNQMTWPGPGHLGGPLPSTFPPTSHYEPPSSSFQPVGAEHPGTGERTVGSLRQPIMSSTAQPSYPAFSAMQGCIPVMMPHAMMPQHHYTSSFPLALPTTPSSPPVGFAAPGEHPGALAAPKPVEGTHHQQEAHQPHHHQEPGLHQYHPQEVSHHPQHLQEAVHHPLHLQDVAQHPQHLHEAQQPPAFRQVEGLARQVEGLALAPPEDAAHQFHNASFDSSIQ